jgi:chemotaxis signal transduction protein
MKESVLTFQVGCTLFGLCTREVEGVVPLPALQDIAETSGALAGLLGLRGTVLPVIDLQALLAFPVRPYTVSSAIVIACTHAGRCGLLAHRVCDVRRMQDVRVTAPSSAQAMQLARYLSGVAWPVSETPNGACAMRHGTETSEEGEVILPAICLLDVSAVMASLTTTPSGVHAK